MIDKQKIEVPAIVIPTLRTMMRAKQQFARDGKYKGIVTCVNCGGAAEYYASESNGHSMGKCTSCTLNWME